jgi:hypothetical protein
MLKAALRLVACDEEDVDEVEQTVEMTFNPVA